MRKERGRIEKIISTFLTIIMFVSYILPTTVIAKDERVDYSVTILPGEGKIQKSLDRCTQANAYNGYKYVNCNKDEFENIDSISITVRENENIKNRIDYTKNIGPNSIWWANDGYITDTKIVKNILINGINTSDYGTSAKYTYNTNTFGDIAYSTECEKVYLFIPPEDKNFSHFIDQDGNTFNLGDTVTKDLVLTPIYIEDDVESVFMNNNICNVTFLKGEGEIYYRKYYDRAADEDINLDKIEFQTYSGEENFYDISQSYAKFRYSDYEKGIEILKNGKKEVLEKIEEENIEGAIEHFKNLLNYAFNELFFTEWLEITVNEDDPSSKYYRENAMSFGALLTTWIEAFGEGDCSAENLSEVLENVNNFEKLTDEEKQNTIDRLITTMDAFEKTWDAYTYSDISIPKEYNLWAEDYLEYKINGTSYTEAIYKGGTTYDEAYFFIPPSTNYEFSHFIDQDGNTFNFGDPITKDLILRPVYINICEIEDNAIEIKVETEDNSNEEFEIDVYREADKLIYNELNDKSSYTFNEEDWTIDENGTIISFNVDPSKIEEKYKKITKTLNIPATEEREEQDITYETGLIPIGIPERINGITVKGISSDAFLKYKSKFNEQCQGNHHDREVDYFQKNWICIYLPETLETFGNSDWINTYFFDGENIKESLEEMKNILKEDGYTLVCLDCFSGIEEGTAVCPDCGGSKIINIDTMEGDVTTDVGNNVILPPTIHMPTTYIVVDPGNVNYTTIHGSLYDKDISKLYYLSYLSQMQSLVLENWNTNYEPINNMVNILSGINGLEIPRTVRDIDTFAINSPYEQFAIHYYGDTLNFEDVKFPTKIIVSYGNDQSKAHFEEKIEFSTFNLGDFRHMYIINKKNMPIVNYYCQTYKDIYGVEVEWALDKSRLFSRFNVDPVIPIICLENENRHKINASGTISKDNPFEIYLYSESILKYKEQLKGLGDPFVRTIRFRNLPDRYIAPKAEDLAFTIDDKEEGITIKLMLKKGNVSVKTTDSEGNNISGTYNIVDEEGNIVGELNSSDGNVVTSEKLAYGKYKIVPTSIKEGYELPLEKEFEIKEDGQIIELEFKVEKKEDPKPEDPKPEDPKPEDPKPEDPKPEDPKPEDPKPEDPKPEDPKPEDPKPEDPKPDDPKPEDPKPEDPKPEDPKPEDPKPEDPKPEDQKENIATNKMPYTGATIGTLIIVLTTGGISSIAYLSRKKYKE